MAGRLRAGMELRDCDARGSPAGGKKTHSYSKRVLSILAFNGLIPSRCCVGWVSDWFSRTLVC